MDITRSTPVNSKTGSLPVHGQFDGGVGIRNVWRGSHKSLHINHLKIQYFKSEIQSQTVLRQRNCGELSMEGGRNSISGSLPSFVGNSPDLPGLADSPACQTHSVSSECDSRQSIMLQASVHGMADQPHLSTLSIDLCVKQSTVRPTQMFRTKWLVKRRNLTVQTALVKMRESMSPMSQIGTGEGFSGFLLLKELHSLMSISLPRHEHEGGRCAISLVGFSGVLYTFLPTRC